MCCAAALASLKVLLREDWVAQAETKGQYIEDALRSHPAVREIRRSGLLLAVDLGREDYASQMLGLLLDEGAVSDYFLYNPTSFRIAPPLCISMEEADMAVNAVIRALDKLVGLEAGKKPPQALDVEEAVLGAMLIEPNAVPDVLDSLTADCFYKDAHRKIFSAISSLSLAHDPVDIYTVAEQLKKDGSLEEIGGPYYLSLLSSKVGAAAHVDYHVKILLQKYIQRELITISAQVQRDSFDDGIPVDDLLDGAQQKLFNLAEKNMKRETQPVQDVIKEAVMEIEANQERTDGLSGVASGYTGIDRITLGWQASDLVIIAARPAMGKTAFVLTMARNMTVDHRIPVAFFSLEMSSKQLVKRLLVSETGLSSEKIRGGKKLQEYELVQLHERIKELRLRFTLTILRRFRYMSCAPRPAAWCATLESSSSS